MSEAAAIQNTQAPVRIVAQGLRHVYKGRTVALDGVDLEIGTGLFGLLGPNGAGKSTLMRIMCTLLVPTAGRLQVGGHDVVKQRLAVRKLVGYLPQEFGAWRLQRVEEVLDTLTRLSGIRDKRRPGFSAAGSGVSQSQCRNPPRYNPSPVRRRAGKIRSFRRLELAQCSRRC